MTAPLSFERVQRLERTAAPAQRARRTTGVPHLRERLIAEGVIREAAADELSRTPPLDHVRVLRIDAAGRDAARRTIARPTPAHVVFDAGLDDAIGQSRRRGT